MTGRLRINKHVVCVKLQYLSLTNVYSLRELVILVQHCSSQPYLSCSEDVSIDNYTNSQF